MTAGTRRHHTVEHIHAEGDIFEDVDRCTNAHEVAGLVGGELTAAMVGHLVHHFGRLAYGNATDGDAVAIVLDNFLHGAAAQILENAALHDGKQRLVVTVFRFGMFVVLPTAVEPAEGDVERLAGILVVARIGRAFIKCHHNIGAYRALNVNYFLGTKKVAGAVDMRLKPNTLFGFNFTTFAKGEHLEAAAVGEDGAVPAIETMEPAGSLNDLHAGAQIEVVSVTENNLSLHAIA